MTLHTTWTNRHISLPSALTTHGRRGLRSEKYFSSTWLYPRLICNLQLFRVKSLTCTTGFPWLLFNNLFPIRMYGNVSRRLSRRCGRLYRCYGSHTCSLNPNASSFETGASSLDPVCSGGGALIGESKIGQNMRARLQCRPLLLPKIPPFGA